MGTLKPLLLIGLVVVLAGFVAGQDDKKDDKKDEKKPAEPGTLIVIDSAGKEHLVKKYEFKAGVRRLGWLGTDKEEPAPEKDKENGKDKEKGKVNGKDKKGQPGPEALVIRDELKINFIVGVETLITLDRLRSVTFDNTKGTMTAVAVGDKDEEVSLVGATKYKGINKITLKAEVNKGDDGVVELTYQGGILKGGIKGIRFPAVKVTAEKPGRPAVVQTADESVKKSHKVSDLMPLYVGKGGKEKTSPLLLFKKTLKLDVGKIKKIVVPDEASDDIVWQVTTKGDESPLTLIPSATIDGQSMQLFGFVGRVPVGFKLFPLKRITAIQFDASEEPKDEKDKKDKDEKKGKDKKEDDFAG